MRRFAAAPFAALALAALAALLFAAAPALAEPTPITMRVSSVGAKYIGDSAGGARIVLSRADTGEILASGVTSGPSGEAAFTTEIDIDRPTLVRAEAFGPLGQRQAATRVSEERWVLPGEAVDAGGGWVLTRHGLLVDVLEPVGASRVHGLPRGLRIEASVTMGCGCPVTPGGAWDAAGFEVRALLYADGKPVREVAMEPTGEVSRFAGSLMLEEGGAYRAVVVAHRPEDDQTGVDQAVFKAGP
ncbi:hypothetical protein [Desulfohalovibrio reitneri]|uniref:hypothetical protein n=1 Tax=Desulfohalovibrio reitneri TaxID=1307759 RepID=UPI0004A73D51|nr:hypothetical protein [Desulfohalovibrio reitneri]